MNWKKNGFSYILWMIYTAIVGTGILGSVVYVCQKKSYPMEYGIAIAIGYLIISGLLVLLVYGWQKRRNFSQRTGNSLAFGVIEALAVVLLAVTGSYLRISLILSTTENIGGMVYYDAARVTATEGVPRVVHGATYLYLQLLHLLFIVAGNKLAVAVTLNIVLQLLVGMTLYVTVRRFAGGLAGSLVLAFFMLSPYLTETVLELSPAFFYLFFYLLGLLAVSGILQKSSGSPVWYILVGVLLGVLCYLDVSGITLLWALGAVFTVERKPHKKFYNSRMAVFLFGVFGFLTGFFGSIGVDAAACGKEYWNILTAWAEICQPGTLKLAASTWRGASYIDSIVLLGILVIGVFSFWCRRHRERQGVWIGITAVMLVMQGYQMMMQNAGSQVYAYVFLAVLAGIGVENLLAVDTETALEKKEVETDVLQEQEAVQEESEIEETAVEALEIEEQEAVPKVQFLENPLPLPKKHEPRVMDYRYTEMNDKKDYDYEVSENDDFDI